jgi:DNA polymerase V
VDRSLTAKNGDVIVANFNGCFVCKLIDKKQSRLLSAAAGFSPVSITPEDEFSLEGVVTRSIRLHHQSPEIVACML